MDQHSCSRCIYAAECLRGRACGYYTPEDEGELEEEYAESGREEYRRAWEEYMEEAGGRC